MILNRFPNGYGDEVRGIQSATQIKMSSLLAFNLGYEIMGACTSVVAQDSNGHMYHGRNLDFGLFLGANFSSGPNNNFQWTNTDLLRQITVVTDFTRNGQVCTFLYVFIYIYVFYDKPINRCFTQVCHTSATWVF
jgi:acid ceramidase